MKFKKLVLILSVILGLFIVGCSNENDNTTSQNDENNAENSEGNNDNGVNSDLSYPEQPIELMVPANPGGATDASARIMSEYLKEYLGESIVVINEAGGGGTIAFEDVRNAEADGYKLLFFHQAMHTGYATDRFEHSATDLKAIGTFSAVNQAYVVSADSPWDSLEDFVQDAEANPGEYSFGAQLSGTTHFMAAMLSQEADVDFQILDFGTESERMSALLGNQVDVVVSSVQNAVEYVESGDFKVLAVLTDERTDEAPDFLTAKEQGYDIQFSLQHTLYGPADLPDEIVKVLNDATEEMAADSEYIEALENLGHVHPLNNSEETTEMVEKEFDYIQELGESLGF